jgi:hypothetical protein
MGWRGFGFVHRSRTVFCRAVPNLSITIRNCFIAVPQQPSHSGRRSLRWASAGRWRRGRRRRRRAAAATRPVRWIIRLTQDKLDPRHPKPQPDDILWIARVCVLVQTGSIRWLGSVLFLSIDGNAACGVFIRL